MRFSGLGFGVSGLGFGVSGLGFRVWSLGWFKFRVDRVDEVQKVYLSDCLGFIGFYCV